MARKAPARSPAVIPCEAGPVTFAAVMVPEKVPEAAAGHAGWPPPPHSQIITPPATCTSPKWMCDTIALLLRFMKVSVKVIVPLGSIVARNEAVAALLIAGTSCTPRRLAVRLIPSSARAPATVVARAQTEIKKPTLILFIGTLRF